MDQGRNHSSGHESHGVYLCHKCGWPFPNPHPSAKHRRAHKKICGTIEGFKLVGSVDITSTASDDEPLSDEDHKTPITQVPKITEIGSLEKNIGGIGAISYRSEDEVFSDAAMEFQDGGVGLGRQDSLDNASKADKIAATDLTGTVSFKHCKDTDTLEPAQNSADRIQEENPDPESMAILPMGTPEHQDVGFSYSKDSEDRNASASDVVPIETETLMGISEESREVSAGARVAECSVGQPIDANENEEGKLNKNLSDGLILPSEHASGISKTVSISEKRLNITSDMFLTDHTLQLKEEFSDRLASKTSMNENGKQEETDGKGNPAINLEGNLMDIVASNSEDASVASEKTEVITSVTVLASKIVEIEENSDSSALNMVIDDLSPEAESAKDTYASTDTFQILTDAAQGADSATAVSSSEVYGKSKRENESFYLLSVPDDIPVVNTAEIKLEDFKDHKKVKLPQLEALASEEIIIDKEDEVRDRVSPDKSDTFLSNPLNEDIKVDASYMDVAEDSNKLGGNNEAMVKEVFVERKADVFQMHKWSDALSPVDSDTTENEKDRKVCFLQEQQPVFVADDLHQTGFSGSMINDLPDVKPMVGTVDIEARQFNDVVGSDDVGFSERAGTGACDTAGGDNLGRIDDEDHARNTSCESTNNSSLSHTNAASNLLEVDNSDDIGARKTGKYDIDLVESGDGPEDGYISIKTNSTFESTSTHHQSTVVMEEVNETGGPDLDRVSSRKDDIKVSEISSDNKVQGECAGKDLMASAVDNSGGNEFESTSVDQLKEESIRSPSYPEPTSQTSGYTRESGVAASGTSSVILQGEADNGSAKPQLDATVVDISIESSSQTDSMEGHWGSISVLSTQSDNPAAIDTETLPSTGSHAFSEADKADIKKSKVASEQHVDKSDEFEPPSFMTLIEPGVGDANAAVSEIQAVQNAQIPRASPLQAGWFPSLTHAMNESPGRKKNEEIIEKVTNWNAKQHTPLKNLLSEANIETKPKSPNSKEKPPVVIPREEKVAKDNGASGAKVSSTAGTKTPVGEPTYIEAGKEWNSPARYPADIKREKRKVKGRPLWVQFVCCSSVN